MVCANGAEFEPEWVISSAHPKATIALLSDQSLFPPVFKERLRSLKESIGIFGMYAVCRERPPTQPDTNYYFFRSSDPRTMFSATNPSDDPPVVFMSSPKRTWTEQEKNFPMSLHVAGPFEWFTPWLNETYGRRSPGYNNIKASIAETYRDWETDRKSTRLNSSHEIPSRMPSSA